MNKFKIPNQMLSYKRKTKKWRKQHLDFADNRSTIHYSPTRKDLRNKIINQDLVEGKIHMDDIVQILDPSDSGASYVPDKIQHYPIINSKLDVLLGEELNRPFDFSVIVTNPLSLSAIEQTKEQEVQEELQSLIQDLSMSDEELEENIQKLDYKFKYKWKDHREVSCNYLLNHYYKEQNMPSIFNEGFKDAFTFGEEIYRCDVVGGEPFLERINPKKARILLSGYSNKIEDADMIILEDYYSPGQILDRYYDVLSQADVKKIQQANDNFSFETEGTIDERNSFISAEGIIDTETAYTLLSPSSATKGAYKDPYGNIRVLQVFWKSKRKIKKVTSFDPLTGEQVHDFFPEDFQIRPELGETEKIYWINEAWEGTKIGKDIYVNMRPRVVQYNRLSNPSRCHFGIVGTIYNFNSGRPYSIVDMMKPYNYLYDVIHDRLNRLIAQNWGKLVEFDKAQIPKGWDVDKWMYFAKVHGIAVKDSFKEGTIGMATGKLAGNMANNNRGSIDAETGNHIQYYVNLLEFIKLEMAEVVGITRQREGQIQNRETVGGVERSTLQSTHITEYWFKTHNDTKRRVLECFLETAKVALKGGSKKFTYILPDDSRKILTIDGDVFAENDYGIMVDNSNDVQVMNQKLDSLAQAALQNQALSFSTIMKLYSSISIAEKQRIIEDNEQKIMEQAEAARQQEMEQSMEELQYNMELEERKLALEEEKNLRDNETKIQIALLQAAKDESKDEIDTKGDSVKEYKEKLLEEMRQFNQKLKLERDKFNFEKVAHKDEIELKKRQISSQKVTKEKTAK